MDVDVPTFENMDSEELTKMDVLGVSFWLENQGFSDEVVKAFVGK